MDGTLTEYKMNATVSDMMKEGFFRNLKPREQMLEAIRYLLEFQKEETEVFILSAVFPQTETESKREKNLWLDKYLPEIDSCHRIYTRVGEDKASFIGTIGENDILVDDYSRNLSQWVEKGGRAIKILNEVNGKNGSFQKGIRLDIKKSSDLFQALNKKAS